MGTVYRPTYTKPLPEGAELLTRKGVRFARWTDKRGRKGTAKVTTGRDGSPRIVLECRTHTAKLRNGAGQLVKVATGCRSKDAAASVLNELHQRAEKVRCGTLSAAEDATLDYRSTPIAEHVAEYLKHLRTKRGKGGKPTVNRQHCANIKHRLVRIMSECRFKRLRDLNRRAMERWADAREAERMGARTLNGHLSALCAFGNWCVQQGRLAVNPFARPPRRDEKADCKRSRRALTEDELRRLLKVAQLRPVAEYGRAVEKVDDAAERQNPKSRRTWKRAALRYADLDDATERGRKALYERPDYIAKLERRGRERALVYKVLTLTGLRRGELAALTVGHVQLDGPVPYIVLDAADEKAGRGAEIPLRADLATDLSEWLADKLQAVRSDARRVVGASVPLRLPASTPVFNVPVGLSRTLNRDLKAADIPKVDDRGRVVDVHALRTTFGSHLSKGGVAPRTAQAAMRHSSLEMTMGAYTDPALLDVAGAMNVLPELPLEAGSGAEHQRATGTLGAIGAEDSTGRKLVPDLVPTAGKRCTQEATAGKRANSGPDGDAAAMSCADKRSERVATSDELRALGLEPRTYGLKGRCSTN